MSTAQLYDRDLAEWARQNAELLRSGRFSEADIEHIAEEIEDMSKRERHTLHSRLTRRLAGDAAGHLQPLVREPSLAAAKQASAPKQASAR